MYKQTLVDRVARALWDAHDGVITLAWEDATEHYRNLYRNMAIAAIIAVEDDECAHCGGRTDENGMCLGER